MPKLSKQEILKACQNKTEPGWVKGVIEVDIDAIIGMGLEAFLDLLSMKLTGTELLQNASYKAVGVLGDFTLLLEVEGDASECFDIEDYEDGALGDLELGN